MHTRIAHSSKNEEITSMREKNQTIISFEKLKRNIKHCNCIHTRMSLEINNRKIYRSKRNTRLAVRFNTKKQREPCFIKRNNFL